jgi:hypothetical protein
MEISKMITRALNKESLAGGLQNKNTGFVDDLQIASADKGYVIILKEYGIINGTDKGYFLPYQTATRAEATKMIVTFLENKNRSISIQPSNYEDCKDGIYLYEFDTKQEQKVTTSHPELLPHIQYAIDMFGNGWGYTNILYSKKYNQIRFSLYENKVEAEKEIWERNTIMSYSIYTEQDADLDYYLPFQISLYNTQNTAGQEYVKTLVKDIFPEAYTTVLTELENKVNNTAYENKVWKDVAGREIRIFTFNGHNQIDIYIAPEK